MFWKYNTLAVSHIDTLLDKQTVTLAEILEQEDIIQECKSQNKKLVDFLTKQEILAELLDLILQEPSEELEERLRFKLPNIASEVITCDVPQINEKLSSDSALLDKMYSFLESPPPLNPLLTSFFSKAFGVLITRRPEQNWYSYQYTCLQVIEYIKAKQGFTGLLLTHIGTSAVMDLLLRLITCVEGTENKQNILTWLNDEQLIQRAVALLAPASVADGGGGDQAEEEKKEETASPVPPPPYLSSEAHDNAGQLLVEIIRVSRDAQITATAAERFANPLLATAESPETVNQLLANMLDGRPDESTIVNGVEVLMALLEIRRPTPQGGGFYQYTMSEEQAPPQQEIDRQQAVVESTADCIIPRLTQLSTLLTNPPSRAAVTTTCGVLDPPLGKTRLALTRLISTLLATNHPPVNKAVAEANIATILLDLFFKYSLNNFLHAQVESCLRSIIFWKDKAAKVEETEPTLESSSLETPKISVEGEEKKDCDETSSAHPLDDVQENPALVHLFTDAALLERLVTSWTSTPTGPCISYMGHITKISNHLVSAMGDDDEGVAVPSRTLLLQLIAKLPEETQANWATIRTGRLQETNTLNELKPASEEKRTLSSDDEDSDFKDIHFPPDSALQQMQEMSENFIDSFGFQDDEFTESEENVSRGMRKLNSVNFLMQTDDSTKQAIFDSVCEQRIQAFSSSPTGESTSPDPWADKTAELTFGGGGAEGKGEFNVEEAQAKLSEIAAAEASSSDEEQDMAPPDRMEVDNDQDPWETIEGPSEGSVAMDTSSPWGPESAENTAPSPWGQDTVQASTTAEQLPQEATGWADFGAFSGQVEGGKIEEMESAEGSKEMKGSWSPAMVSSPEATMLEDTTGSKGGSEESARGASPLLEERLNPDQDEVKQQDVVEGEKKGPLDIKTADDVLKESEPVAAAVKPEGESGDGAT